jgi:hypothetical protein
VGAAGTACRLPEADPRLARTLAGGVEALLAEGDLSVQPRRELEQVHYGVACCAIPDRKSSTREAVPMPGPELGGLTNFLYEMGLLKRYKRTGWMIAGIDKAGPAGGRLRRPSSAGSISRDSALMSDGLTGYAIRQ